MAFLTCNKAGRFTGPASDATSWTIGAPTGGWLTPNNAIPAGQITRWVAIVSSDGTPTLSVGAGSDARWIKIAQDSEATSQVTQAIFFCDTTEAFAVSPSIPTLIVASTASEQFSATIGAFTAAANKVVAYITPTTSQGNSANSDPPAITNSTGASQDLSVICTRGGDSTTTPTVNPTNYTTNLGNTAASGTNGAATTAQVRNITVANGSSEDPGAYTVTTEQWVCHTLALYEANAGSASSAGASTATASGLSTELGAGASAASGSAASVGTATESGAATSVGIASVAGGGAVTAKGNGSSAGSSAVAGSAASANRGVGSSSGIATAAAAGSASKVGVGSATGVSTPNGVGTATALAAGSTAGTGSATGIGARIAIGAGATASVATAIGIGVSVSRGLGTSAGIATATGAGSFTAGIWTNSGRDVADWAPANDVGGDWAVIPANASDFVEQAAATGTWTETPQAGGVWN